MNKKLKYIDVFNNIVDCVLPKLKNKNIKNILKSKYHNSIFDLYFLYFDLRNIIIVDLPKNTTSKLTTPKGVIGCPQGELIKKLGFRVKQINPKLKSGYIIGNTKMNKNKFKKIYKNYKKIYGSYNINPKIQKQTGKELGYFHTDNLNYKNRKSIAFLLMYNKKIITGNIYGPQAIHKKLSKSDKKNIIKKTKYMNFLLSKINPKLKIKYIIK